jgi:hypothetical protein
MILTEEEDKTLRRYAKWLDYELGEDAYHIAIFDTMRRGKTEEIRNIVGYFYVAIKASLYKLYRHEKSERKNVQAFINNDPIPMQTGLAMGRGKSNTCKRGHEWKEEHIFYVQGRRGCLICKKTREREHYHSHKKLKGKVGVV